MFDIGKILKRAWYILWNYRVLWIFGLLLALTAGGAGSNAGSGSGYRFDRTDLSGFSQRQWDPEFSRWLNQNLGPLFVHPGQHVGTWIAIGIGFVLFILIIAAIFALVRYPTETAVIRMVDEYEQTGKKSTFRQGWRLGWSRRAFRMWVIDLIIGVPIFLVVLLSIGLGFGIYYSVISHSQFVNVAGTIASAAGLLLFAIIVFVGSALLSVLRQFFIRKAALENASIGESIKSGWRMFVRNWKNGALTWLVVAGLSIGMGIISIILFFLLIPAYVIMAIPALLVAAVPGLIVFGITMLFGSLPFAAIIGGLFALPIFFIVAFLPLSFVSGLFKVFESNIWTLAYREMKAGEVVKSDQAPENAAEDKVDM